ncbi:MAG: NAD(P)-binding oxidoreductase [Chloroflexota bacterium]|nr:NAD(P)-binding oxidoreductase [Chloroflexota bacterium]
MAKKRVLLTGASGSMGGETFKELLRRKDKYDIVLILRPSKVNKKNFSQYEGQDGITIVWGDLSKPEDVLKAVTGVDHVLHPAAYISPAADHNPKQARKSNYESAVNIIAAIKQQPDNGDNIRLVSIGTVAEYGDRLPPVHWVKVGDPLKPSVGDYYAITKIAAERAIIESGLKYWASMRQTFIAIPNVYSLMDPIMFHQPPETHIEFITSQDAGYGLVQTLECPDDFYGRVYNMAGGPSCRFLYSDYLERFFKLFNLGDFRTMMDRNWFGARNFHCCWYMDTYILNDYLGHWRQTFDDQIKQVDEMVPSIMKFGAGLAPKFIVKAFMKRMADPLKWVQTNDEEKVKAFFGSREAWEKIGGWETYNPKRDTRDLRVEKDPLTKEYTLEEMQALAKSRGGECLSKEYIDIKSKLKWKCASGHEWEATPRLHLTGHWCADCTPPPWDYDAQVKADPALADIYCYNHDENESQRVDYLYCPNE